MLVFGRVKPDPAVHAARMAMPPSLGLAPEQLAYPDKSAALYRYRHPRQHDQRRLGCCVGEGGADAAEIDQRIVRPTPDTPKPVSTSMTFSSLWCYYIARLWAAKQGRPLQGDGAVVSDLIDAIKKWGVIPYASWPSTPANVDGYSDSRPVVSADDPNVQRWFPVDCGLLRSIDEILYTIGTRQIPVLVGSDWRGGFQTGPNNGFPWRGGSAGGHCYTLTAYDRTYPQAPNHRLYIDCAWDPQWGTQPAAGATDAYGNLLPHAYAWTSLDDWAQDFSPAAFANGDVEAIYFAGFAPKGGTPTPPSPPPTPAPVSGKGVVTVGNSTYDVTLTLRG